MGKGNMSYRVYPYSYTKKYQDKYRASQQSFLDEQKAAPCMDCGGVFPPECMDFDHVRGEKSFAISGRLNRSEETFLGEMAKCDLVCSNCHRSRTKGRKQSETAPVLFRVDDHLPRFGSLEFRFNWLLNWIRITEADLARKMQEEV